MKACSGKPGDAKECVLSYKTESGATIEMPTGLTEKKFLETIDNTCVRLCSTGAPDKDIRDAPRQFQGLSRGERKEYFRGLADNAGDRCKARTALVALLQERGIDGWETLSAVNKLPLAKLKLMGETLLTTLKDITGNALRSTQFMRLAVGSVRDAPEAPAAERTFIPALSPEDYNNSVERAIRNGGSLPPGVKMLLEQLRAGMHARFGDAVPANRDLSCLAEGRDVGNICNALAKEGKPATAGNLRETLAEAVLDKSVSDCICKAASAYLDRLGGGNAMRFASLAKSACPDLVADLRAAKTPEEASAAVARHSKALGRIAQRMAPCCRNEDKFVPLYREALAKELGVHIGSDMVKHAETTHLGLSATSITDRICGGALDLETDQEIDDAFRKLAADLARERAGLLGQADKLGLSPLAAKTMKRHILSLGKTNKFDFDKFGAAAAKMKPLAEKVDRLLDEGASADDICNAIGDVFLACKNTVCDLFEKPGQFDDVDADDFVTYGIPLQILATDAVPGLMDKLQAFFDREDVKALDFEDLNGAASKAKSLHVAFEQAAEFVFLPLRA